MIRSGIFLTIIFMLYFIDVGDTFNHSDVKLNNNHETNVQEFENKDVSLLNRKCINKCCPEGQFLLRKQCVKRNIKIGFPIINVYDENVHKIRKKVSDVLTIVSGKLLDKEFKNKSINPVNLDYRPYVTENGDLQLEIPNIYDRWTQITNDNYCVDYSLKGRGVRKSPTFLVLMEDKVQLPSLSESYSPVGLLVSSFFLFLVLLVYILLPELQNICGRILMAYVFSLFMASLLMATIDFTKGHIIANVCVGLTSGIYYFLLASFCWMSVMSCDIWWTFRGYAKARQVQRRKEHFKFLMYSLFAWGVPLVMTIGLLELNNADMKHLPWFVIPQIPDRGCFLQNGVKFLYLYIPMLILITINWIFYLMTAFYLWRLSRGTGILDSPSSPGQNTQRNRFMMYLKLSVVMGLNWIFEILSFKFPEFKIWYISDFFNIFIGFTIFLIYVCKGKIFRMLYKRYVLDYTLFQSSSIKNSNSNSDDSNSDTSQDMLPKAKGFNNITILRDDDSDMKASINENVKFIDKVNPKCAISSLLTARNHSLMYIDLSQGFPQLQRNSSGLHPMAPCYPNRVASLLSEPSCTAFSSSWSQFDKLTYSSVFVGACDRASPLPLQLTQNYTPKI